MPRQRKTRGYNETNDEEDDGGRKYDLKQKIRSERFSECKDFLKELHGHEITLKLIQRYGFDRPILVKEPDGLNLRVPPKGFMVRDVRDCVGDDRIIDVMDVRTQKNIEMSMRDWCTYYESKRRDRLLNVISLEFSHTELDEMVESPSIVRLLDWVDLVWPKFLKESQTESTNKIDKMKYPKVQKYCLMSVKGSYTDFHIDFGGTSVWYHILKGKKIFWMVPPTELNLLTFEEWTLSGMQQEIFFGDTVEECFRVELTAGNTFFIPSGWIHAVYTLEDSLVFGGNFLHSFGIENQLKVSKVEDATKVPVKFRYPFYTEIQWYVVQHYVHCLTGRDHLHPITKSNNTTPEKPKSLKPNLNSRASKLHVKQNDDEVDDDETETESEITESDTCKNKRKSNSKPHATSIKRGRSAKATKLEKGKKIVPDDMTEDDSETEVDTELESDNDEKPNINKPTTCRMTKNSLLRLQYEIDHPSAGPKSNPSKQSSVINPQAIKNDVKATDEKSNQESKVATTTDRKQPCTTSFDIDALMHSSDNAKLNGWSSTAASGGNQVTWSNRDIESNEPTRTHITRFEVDGLRLLIKHLSKLSGAKKHLPSLIRNSRSLLDDCRKMLVEHENDDPELAVTGIPITLELIYPKKSEMSQLIDQFFKPMETIANDETQAQQKSPASKMDSTSLTQQQRNKFSNNNISETTKSDEKDTSVSQKDARGISSPNKKVSNSGNSVSTNVPAASSSGGTTNTHVRPKSPPTRPLSNNQYTSKSKRDSSLILPGSFADLIAATSTDKKVFDVNSADITSTLFGIRETSKSSSKSGSSSPQKMAQSSPIDLLKLQSHPLHDNQTSINEQNHSAPKEGNPPRPNSPEPPKLSPPKRFINPAFKPQNKEKLIFASAPYVSPITVSNQSRPNNLYPWQSPAPHQVNQPKSCGFSSTPKATDIDQHAAQSKQSDNQKHESQPIPVALTAAEFAWNQPAISSQDQSKQSLVTNSKASVTVSKVDDNAKDESDKRKFIEFDGSMDESTRSLKIDSSVNDSSDTLEQSSKIDQTSSKSNSTMSSLPSDTCRGASSITTPTCLVPPSPIETNSSEQNKVVKPRGPPKKSKEARQAIISSPPRPIVSTPQRFLIAQNIGLPLVAGPSAAPVVVSAPTGAQQTAKEKSKSTKKSKKQKASDEAPKPPKANIPPFTSGPSVICGLIAPQVKAQANGPKIAQQYLISRPLLFNPMPGVSTAQLQRMPRAQMPVVPTSLQSSLSFPSMQQGARIVWATQPRQVGTNLTSLTHATPSSSSAPPPTASKLMTTQKTNSVASRAKQLSSSKSTGPRQPDNAALLSLATTALSTAPLSTTPTLSYLSGIRQPTGQAIMVSSATGQPALLTGQPFLNPLIPRLPVVSQFPRVALTSSLPGPNPTLNTLNPPGIPRGQLVFARLPNQTQQRFLITQPYIQPRLQTPVAGQQNQTLAFATFTPTCDNSSKDAMKAKKVKTR